MEWQAALRAAIQEGVLPEFDKLRLENAEIRSTLQLANRRLDDMQLQLVDRSRRLDKTPKRIDRRHEAIIRRDEYIGLERWVRELARKVLVLQNRLPA